LALVVAEGDTRLATVLCAVTVGDALVVGKVADGVASAKALEAIVGWFLS
jgi:hypothetical protein